VLAYALLYVLSRANATQPSGWYRPVPLNPASIQWQNQWQPSDGRQEDSVATSPQHPACCSIIKMDRYSSDGHLGAAVIGHGIRAAMRQE